MYPHQKNCNDMMKTEVTFYLLRTGASAKRKYLASMIIY